MLKTGRGQLLSDTYFTCSKMPILFKYYSKHFVWIALYEANARHESFFFPELIICSSLKKGSPSICQNQVAKG